LFIRNGAKERSATRILRNPNFMREAAQIRRSTQIAPATKE
jgi:hypothetical protein